MRNCPFIMYEKADIIKVLTFQYFGWMHAIKAKNRSLPDVTYRNTNTSSWISFITKILNIDIIELNSELLVISWIPDAMVISFIT